MNNADQDMDLVTDKDKVSSESTDKQSGTSTHTARFQHKFIVKVGNVLTPIKQEPVDLMIKQEPSILKASRLGNAGPSSSTSSGSVCESSVILNSNPFASGLKNCNSDEKKNCNPFASGFKSGNLDEKNNCNPFVNGFKSGNSDDKAIDKLRHDTPYSLPSSSDGAQLTTGHFGTFTHPRLAPTIEGQSTSSSSFVGLSPTQKPCTSADSMFSPPFSLDDNHRRNSPSRGGSPGCSHTQKSSATKSSLDFSTWRNSSRKSRRIDMKSGMKAKHWKELHHQLHYLKSYLGTAFNSKDSANEDGTLGSNQNGNMPVGGSNISADAYIAQVQKWKRKRRHYRNIACMHKERSHDKCESSPSRSEIIPESSTQGVGSFASNSNMDAQDADVCFFKSIIPDVKTLSNARKLQFKSHVMSKLSELITEQRQETGQSVSEQSNVSEPNITQQVPTAEGDNVATMEYLF